MIVILTIDNLESEIERLSSNLQTRVAIDLATISLDLDRSSVGSD